MRRTLEQLIGLLQLTRPLTCLGTSLLTLSGAALAAGGGPLSAAAWRSAALVGLIAAACDTLNDLRDVAVDRLNKPGRPIPAGRVSRRLAIVWMGLLAVAAMVLALSLGAEQFLAALALAVLGAAYSLYFKNTALAGNAVVGFLCGVTVIYGAWVQLGPDLAPVLVGLCVAVFVFAREVLGTVTDAPGDARAGLATVATRWGKPTALRVFYLSALCFALLCALPWFLGLGSPLYLFAVTIIAVVPIAAVAFGLSWRSTDRAIRAARWVMKVQWFTALIAIAFLK